MWGKVTYLGRGELRTESRVILSREPLNEKEVYHKQTKNVSKDIAGADCCAHYVSSFSAKKRLSPRKRSGCDGAE